MLLAAVFWVNPAMAQNTTLTQKQRDVLNNVQMEYSVCVAFYNNMKTCAPKAMAAEAQQKLEPIIKSLLARALQIGQDIGMSNDAIAARFKTVSDDQVTKMKKSCDNLPVINGEHATRCIQLRNNPDSILEEYLKR
jgi:hypothetical protein